MLRFPSMPNFRRLANAVEGELQNSSENSEVIITDGDEGVGGVQHTGPINRKKQKIVKLYRSSCPDSLTEEEMELFRSINFKSIIDFRSRTEYYKGRTAKLIDRYYSLYKVKVPSWRKYKPNENVTCVLLKSAENNSEGSTTNKIEPEKKHFLINFFNLNYVWEIFNRVSIFWRFFSLFYLLLDFILGTDNRYFVRIFAKKTLNKQGLIGQYVDILNHSQSSICAALKLLCDPKNIPAMLNCAHGKDRTGIVSALVLSCLGYSEDCICDDYARSAVQLAPIRSLLEKDIVERYHMCKTFTTADRQTMKQTLEYINEKYGGVIEYLEVIGFSLEDQQKLRDNLSD